MLAGSVANSHNGSYVPLSGCQALTRGTRSCYHPFGIELVSWNSTNRLHNVRKRGCSVLHCDRIAVYDFANGLSNQPTHQPTIQPTNQTTNQPSKQAERQTGRQANRKQTDVNLNDSRMEDVCSYVNAFPICKSWQFICMWSLRGTRSGTRVRGGQMRAAGWSSALCGRLSRMVSRCVTLREIFSSQLRDQPFLWVSSKVKIEVLTWKVSYWLQKF